ncbi:hypothetical protein NPX13_g4383 [Xylaria arbuscula]|uniref:Heterokaryon incompatibility domain-containing protein n=1 Tax=Xylaria arbuscula TaxID=114810 RepID=A0A9W8NGH3_9PEZI|nr:hypothetical protein NPX13_g4383 [Xylaria arbuscula]
MADIYSKAKTVQVWLSPHSPPMTEAIQFIENLSSKATSFGANDEILPLSRDHLPSIAISQDKAKVLINDAIHAHVDVFFLCSWFNRVWIVQEATLATELVLSCGLSTIRWDVFAVGAKILRGALRNLPDTTERQRMGSIKPA